MVRTHQHPRRAAAGRGRLTPRFRSAARIRGFARRLRADQSGGEIIEYVLIAGLSIVGTIVTVAAFGTKVAARWTTVGNSSL